ncbi:Predicted metal-dependent peptidase [Loktanella sp. DSM 29012]|uniref:vWA domain-containing protein n=1 Tax=Loktanella sp. DSM 29012 TaxID=1881056 RepID=UPI0008C7AD88|nr:VWA-like domain-containing protein [Loktanella sp. DSM 29012]SEQ47966.1 Predicted metal-dependent peptidase [Loktanella sp. DSM 29012]
MNRHSSRATAALTALAEADPALAALSLWCDHRDGDTTATAGTTITYGPDFAALSRPEQMGLAAHHILHVALRHSARLNDLRRRLGDTFDSQLWQLCADALVNEALLQSDHALPRPAVTLTGLLDSIGQEVSGPQALADWDSDRLYFTIMGAIGDKRAAGDARAYARQQAFAGDIRPGDGADDQQGGDREQAAAWAQHMARALQAGRTAGRGLGLIGHRIADIPAPRTPWEIVLRRLLTAAITVAPQTSPMRPTRRWIAGTAQARADATRQPGFQAGHRPFTDVPRIAVAVDASGSIDDARLAMFWAEVLGITRRLRAEVVLIIFDEAVRSVSRIDAAAQTVPLPDLPRGGGTDFQPVIAAAQTDGATALVILTDLDGPTGPAPKGLKVFWAVPQPGDLMPTFGQVIDLSA